MNNASKLDYLLTNYTSAAKVIDAFGFKTSSMITNMRHGKSNIANVHMEGLEKHFNIPQKVFANEITTTQEIDLLIKNYQEEQKEKQKREKLQTKILKRLEETRLIPKGIFDKTFQEKGELDGFIKKHKEECLQESISLTDVNSFSSQVFPENQKLFNKLKGVWYGYVYPSNPASAEHGIWEVETTIHDDYSVVDYWGNRGYLKLGKNESLIIKESYDNNDLTVIRFSNRQVPSQHFRFVIVSNQNNTENEMVNFGFYSRIKYSAKEAKNILGNITNMQLKLDLNFNNRVNELCIVPR